MSRLDKFGGNNEQPQGPPHASYRYSDTNVQVRRKVTKSNKLTDNTECSQKGYPHTVAVYDKKLLSTVFINRIFPLMFHFGIISEI